jgi:PAS domain S-box-containing protein
MTKLREHLRRMGVAYIILLISLTPAAFVYQRVKANVRIREEARLNAAVRDITDQIDHQFTDVTHVLWGVRGLFLASHKVRANEWNLFLNSVQFSEKNTGMRDLGFALRVPATNLATHIQEQQRENRSDYAIGPIGERDEYFPIIFLRDQQDGDVRSLGWDPYANPERRAAMDAARDTGEPIATVEVPMARPTGEFTMTGHIVYFPVYHGAVEPQTVAERREKLVGFVFASFQEERFWRALFDDPIELFDIDIFQGKSSGDGKLVFDSDPGLTRAKAEANQALVTEKPLNYFGLNWAMRATTRPKFGVGDERYFPMVALAGCVALSFALFLLAAIQARSRAALQHEKEQLAVTLRSIADGVIATDRDGKILLFNNAAEQITGWIQTEALGRHIQGVFVVHDEKTREKLKTVAAQILEGNESEAATNRSAMLIARNGTERIISKSAAPMHDSHSRLIGVVVVFRDITEKRRFETELLKASKLESVGVLAGGIAHDFNNILSIVLGNVSLCKMMAEPNSEIHTRLGSAEKGCVRARELTQQLLTFAKGGAPILQSASVEEIIQESTAFAARGSNIACQHEADADLWAVEADEGQISQVFNNLVINAVQAMPKGGTITTRATNCVIDQSTSLPIAPGRYVHIVVQDTGCGIPPENIARIFDPYFTTKQNGSGLGLATAYAIIQKHEGCINVESRVGEGTTFHIYLPASDSLPRRKNGDTQMFTRGVASGRILVMDDELPIREIARASLSHLGYEVDTAEHGNEALEKFQTARNQGRPYTAVIMDLTVPGGMGGKETIKRLLDIDPKVQAIVSSGYSHDPVMANYRDFGFVGVVEKPYKISSLAKALASLTPNGAARN